MQAAPPPSAQVLPESGETHAAGRQTAPPAARQPHRRPDLRLHRSPLTWRRPSRSTPDRSLPPLRGRLLPSRAAATSGPMPDADVAGATVIPRRPVIEGAARSRADVPWLGIGSWLLLCGALFASLVGWPDQTALDRVTSIWSSEPPSDVA